MLIFLVTVSEYIHIAGHLCPICKIMTFGFHENVLCVFRAFGRLWNFLNICHAVSRQTYKRKVLCVLTSCVDAG